MRLQLLPNYSNSIKHLPNNDQEKREQLQVALKNVKRETSNASFFRGGYRVYLINKLL